ncbi:MAG: ABC transporter permease subunit [Candidatus Aenigmatarchaeota archaeon]
MSSRTEKILNALGIVLLFFIWWELVFIFKFKSVILPHPIDVIRDFPELFTRYNIIRNTMFSIFINVVGFSQALLLSIPLGFLISEIPFFKGLSYRWVLLLRFLPITAFFGMFITWFGDDWLMKSQFLFFGVFLYLVPTVAHRAWEVPSLKVDVMRTLGAKSRQIFWIAVFPDTMSRLWADIITLSAVTWTYIAVAETVNMGSGGGLGAMCYNFGLKSATSLVFGCLLVLLFVGAIQDQFSKFLGRFFFPYKRKKRR